MPTDTQNRVHDLLRRMPTDGLRAVKQLFCTELNYSHANIPLSCRDWPDRARDTLAEPPLILARNESRFGDFPAIYARLSAAQRGRDFPLSLAAERAVINELLPDHPYALFVFSDAEQQHWHLVNVRYDKEAARRRIFRRIAVGPHERLRTAAERVALLDVRDLAAASPLAVQQRHDEAFDVEAVTRRFFSDYRRLFEDAEARIAGLAGEELRLFTQLLFNRLLFTTFLERKGWLSLAGRDDYLHALWEAHRAEARAGNAEVNFYRDRLALLFFSGLNNPSHVDLMRINQGGFLGERIGQVPYLNGGLFEQEALDRQPGVTVPDAIFGPILDDLVYHYNFTVTESTPLDVEVAVDPEMLGKIFEELITGRHESGSYYTPKTVVAFMGREALKGYLRETCPQETEEAIAAFVEQRDSSGIRQPEALLDALQTVRVCDPACGSGAYLVGMLHELVDLRQALFATQRLDSLSAYERKLQIIQRNLYGVDIDPFAVNIARLRLWLSLIVDFEGETPPPLPNLEFKIEVGDSLTGPAPGQLQPGLFHHQQVQEYFRLKGQFMTAHGPEKAQLRQEIERLRQGIAAWASVGGGQGFDWAVTFAEVFAGPGWAPQTMTGAMSALVNVTPGQMELTARQGRPAGFDIVVANPPYVRADAQYRHIEDEAERQEAIARWQRYRQDLKSGRAYETLYEKWDLYIPFLERAWQLLCPGGQMVFIIADAYNAAKYAKKSHEFFLARARVVRLDFCSDIPLFEAGVSNTIVHFARTQPDAAHTPLRFRRWGEKPDDFEDNVEALPVLPQAVFGPALFRPGGRGPTEADRAFVPLENVCYISVGMVINADERGTQGEFDAEDVLSSVCDDTHPKRFVLGKDVLKWALRNVRYLEWGTDRAPGKFRRRTFSQMHEAKEKLIAVRTPGATLKVIYDDNHLHFDASSVGFVPWHFLKDVVNKSVKKAAKYRYQAPDGDREDRERVSQQFQPKYLLAIMNSSFARDWLASRRRSKIHIYPDDWKPLPIAPLPLEAQQEFVRLVDAILAEFAQHGYPLPAESAARVAELEREIDARVARLYGGAGSEA